jgi:hypothetical protein
MSLSRRPHYVSASDIASLGYCETKLVLEATHGEIVTEHQAQARVRGQVEHQRFDQLATTHHNPAPTPEGRGPCWIASAVYGVNDPRTNELRDFRDEVLMRNPVGRLLVRGYYRASPPVARALARRPRLAYAVSRMLDGVRFILGTTWRSHRNEHSHPAG